MIVWTRDDAILRVDASGAALEAAGETTRATPDEVSRGAWDGALLRRFDLNVAVEARAAAAHHDRLAAQLGIGPPTGRPAFDRVLGGGRGVGWVVWVRGRRVQVRVPDVDDDLHTHFAALELDGLPAEYADGLPASAAERLRAMVAALSPLDCMCGTGCETGEQHGDVEDLAGPVQHPNAPIEHRVSVGACRVCDRAWTFESAGDSHYGYRERMRRFSGEPG